MKNEQDHVSLSAPKMKFVPKIPPRKQSKAAATKVEPSETKGDLVDKELLAKLNTAKSENSFGRRPKTERKSAPVQVAFGQGSSSLIRSFGNPRSAAGSSSLTRSFGNPRSAATGGKHEDGTDVSVPLMKEYVEPWDYVRTYYPITLPMRRPYSGDPEILDKEEFGEDSASGNNMSSVSPAEELGLMEASTEPQMFLFQLPATLPLAKRPTAAVDVKGSDDGPDAANAGNKGSGNRLDTAAAESQTSGSRPADVDGKSKKGCTLKDLPSGFIGKIFVYKSGKVKMKIGDAHFDVSPGQNCVFAQEAAVINVKEKHCCVLGDLPKRVVVTPDVDSLLESMENL